MTDVLPELSPELVWQTVDLGEGKVPAKLGVAPSGDSYSPFLKGVWQGLQFSIAPYPGLTGRENQVLALSCFGQEEPGIATHLGIDGDTVHMQRNSMLRKLDSSKMNVCVELALLAGVFRNVTSTSGVRLPVLKPDEQAIVTAFRNGAHNRAEVVRITRLPTESNVKNKTSAMFGKLRVANMAGAILLDGLIELATKTKLA